MDKSTEKQTVGLADEQLIELYWQRNENAIKETEVKYGNMLFRVAYHILHDKADCEECKNDTYLCIWNRIPPTRPTMFRAFITKIMRDVAINKYNEKTRKKRIPSELTVSLEELCDIFQNDDLPDADCAAEELSEIITAYVRALPKRKHYIFIGRFYFGSSLEQIADELGIHASTVQREIVKIKADLKIHLERNGVCV